MCVGLCEHLVGVLRPDEGAGAFVPAGHEAADRVDQLAFDHATNRLARAHAHGSNWPMIGATGQRVPRRLRP